jgi:hypothetical protein
MTCLGCCGVHTSFEPALACYRAAYPKPPSTASTGPLSPDDDVETGADSHEITADSGALSEGGTGEAPPRRERHTAPCRAPHCLREAPSLLADGLPRLQPVHAGRGGALVSPAFSRIVDVGGGNGTLMVELLKTYSKPTLSRSA